MAPSVESSIRAVSVRRRQNSKETWRGSIAPSSIGGASGGGRGATSDRGGGSEEFNDEYDMMLDDISHDIGELRVDNDSS